MLLTDSTFLVSYANSKLFSLIFKILQNDGIYYIFSYGTNKDQKFIRAVADSYWFSFHSGFFPSTSFL